MEEKKEEDIEDFGDFDEDAPRPKPKMPKHPKHLPFYIRKRIDDPKELAKLKYDIERMTPDERHEAFLEQEEQDAEDRAEDERIWALEAEEEERQEREKKRKQEIAAVNMKKSDKRNAYLKKIELRKLIPWSIFSILITVSIIVLAIVIMQFHNKAAKSKEPMLDKIKNIGLMKLRDSGGSISSILNGTNTATTTPKPPKLVYVQLLFRSGATDGDFYSDILEDSATKINQRGISNSEKLANFLKSKYAPKREEVLWISTSDIKNRMTSEEINRVLFNETSITSLDTKTGNMIHTYKCTMFAFYLEKKYPCPTNEGSDMCIFTTETSKSENTFNEDQKKANKFKNGQSVDDSDAAMKTVAEYESYRGIFDNNDYIRIKYSTIIKLLLDGIQNSYNLYKSGKSDKKMTFYSVEDWIILGLLHVSGFINKVEPETLPEWNSMLIYELWEINDVPVVKVFHKKDEVKTDLEDYSKRIRKCETVADGCSMKSFIDSFNGFHDNGETCKNFKATK